MPPTPSLDLSTLTRMLDHASVAVILADASAAICFASRPAGRMAARPVDALLGLALHDLLPADRRDAFAARWKEACAGGAVAGVETEIQRADGQRTLVEIDLLPMPTPSGACVQVNLRSLAAIRSAQAQTEEAAAELAKERRAQAAFLGILQLLNESTDPAAILRVGLTDSAKAVGAQLGYLYTLDANRAPRLAARYAPGESKGPAPSAWAKGIAARVIETGKAAIPDAVPADADLTIRTGRWEKRPTGVAAFPLRFRDDIRGVLLLAGLRPFGPEDLRLMQILANQIAFALSNAEALRSAQAMAEELAEKSRRLEGQSDELLRKSEELFSQDITLIKQQEALGKIDKLKADLLEKMSRELRTPLNRMISHLIAVLTNDEERISSESVEHLRSALGDGTAFSRTLSNLVDLWRIREGQLQPDFKLVHFEAIVEEAVHHVAQLARDRQVDVIRDIEGVTDPIRTDLAKITEVMTEVIGNAVKFTSKGVVRITASTGQGSLICQVADTGIGIAPDDIEHVYDEFYQVDESGDRGFHGAGLGLCIAKRLVELLHGTITIESEIGEGTTVTISLPGHPSAEGAPA